MKKTIYILLSIIAILFSFQAIAEEEISTRDEIVFGCTMEDVLAKEPFQIDEIDRIRDSWDSAYPFSIKTHSEPLSENINAYIKYFFDADKTLREIVYYFAPHSTLIASEAEYATINNELVLKYGSPLDYSAGEYCLFVGGALTSAVSSVDYMESVGGYGSVIACAEWDVDMNDYHIKVEEAQFNYGASRSKLSYAHVLSYTYFTDEDIQAIQNAQ